MNLEDIAKLAGVSRSTVSRVVNNDPNVSPAVRARVQRTIDEVGYKPHAAARALASHRSRAIGLVVPEDFSRYHVDTWYPIIIEATLSATRDAGLTLMLMMEDTFSPGAGRRVIDQFVLTGRVDGLLVLMHSYDDHLTLPLIEHGVPVVLLAESDIPGALWVDNDNRAGGRLIGELIRQSGAETAVSLTGSTRHVPSVRRVEGFREIFPESSTISVPYSTLQAAEMIRDLLLGPHRPDAIFTVNGWLAPITYRIAQELGIEIPDSLVVGSFDEFDHDLNESLGVTTAIQQTTTLAKRAVQLLKERIEGRSPPPDAGLLEIAVIERGSCRERTGAVSRR